MDSRQEQLRGWARSTLGVDGEADWRAVAGDASARRYFRLSAGSQSWICADAPPPGEKPREFCALAELLQGGGVRVPAVLDADLHRGFLLLEDLGDTLLADRLHESSVDGLYASAMDMLFRLQAIGDVQGQVPDYDRAILGEELSRFGRWFCEGLLGIAFTPAEQALLDATFEGWVRSALEQPRVLVHVDFHSRNLLLEPSGELATIDFQDARFGPVCYDLVSLLRDCYVQWPEQQVAEWALGYRARLVGAGRPAGESDAQFLRWFDWMGLQRHIKVLGNFARLALRDNKPRYLDDVPRVMAHIDAVQSRYPELEEFRRWFDDRVTPAWEALVL